MGASVLAEVAVLAVVVAAEVELVAGAGVAVAGLGTHQNRCARGGIVQIHSPSGVRGLDEPVRDGVVRRGALQFGVAGRADADRAFGSAPDDDVPFGVWAGDELVSHVLPPFRRGCVGQARSVSV